MCRLHNTVLYFLDGSQVVHLVWIILIDEVLSKLQVSQYQTQRIWLPQYQSLQAPPRPHATSGIPMYRMN